MGQFQGESEGKITKFSANKQFERLTPGHGPVSSHISESRKSTVIGPLPTKGCGSHLYK